MHRFRRYDGLQLIWRLLQATVAGAVLCANVYWQLIKYPMIACIVAGLAAMFVTWLIIGIIDLRRYGWRSIDWWSAILGRQQRSDYRAHRRVGPGSR